MVVGNGLAAMSATGGHSKNPNTENRRRLVKVNVPADFFPRAMSIAIDEGVCFVIAWELLTALSIPVLFERVVINEHINATKVVNNPWPLFFGLLGVRMCYFVPQWAIFGKTLPNRLVGIKVADSRSERRLSLFRSAWRVTVTNLIVTPYFVGAVVIVLSLWLQQAKGLRWIEEGQGVHDKLAGSIVLGERMVSRRQDLEGSYFDLMKR